MSAFERWAAGCDCTLVALATRRAASFYRALGYQDSGAYLRKVLQRSAMTRGPMCGVRGECCHEMLAPAPARASSERQPSRTSFPL